MCTSIIFKSHRHLYLANNEDIFLPVGMLFTNQRGVRKTALLMPPDPPLQWVSRYGSIIFSQSGKEFPSGGMNETGLVVEQTTLRETRYPAPDSRPGIKELQLIQYLLDTCATVGSALQNLLEVRIAQATATIQFMLLDRQGASAIVEFLDGQMLVFKDENMPVAVLTNTIYPDSIAFLDSDGTQTPQLFDDYAKNSIERFCTAAKLKKQLSREDTLSLDQVFEILAAVERPDSIWNIIYDPISLAIHIKTQWDRREKLVRFSEFDFSAGATPLALDLQAPANGNLRPHFLEYSTEINRELIHNFFHNEIIRQVLKVDLPDELLEYLAAYPQQMVTGA